VKLFILDELDWRQTQLIYHALAYLNIESLVLHSSIGRYICVGLHQNPQDELDLKFCKRNDIGIFRREIGGGTVLLDNNQIFYHLILHRKNPKVPYSTEGFFRKFLHPVIQTCYELGISAEYRPLCDLVVNEKKISGNGGGEVGECKVLGGNILLNFDHEIMAQAMLFPNKFRFRILELMRDNITTVQKELGAIPSKQEIYLLLSKKFANILGSMTKGKIGTEITKKMLDLNKLYLSSKWLYQRGTKQIGREIKIREGVFLFYKSFYTTEGIEEVVCEINQNRVKKITILNSSSKAYIEQMKIQKNVLGLEYDKNMVINKILKMIESKGGRVVA